MPTQRSDIFHEESSDDEDQDHNEDVENDQNASNIEESVYLHKSYRNLKVLWRKKEHNLMPSSNDDNFPDPTEPLLSALAYFQIVISTDMIKLLVEQTNLYSIQQTGTSLMVTANEIIGKIIIIGLVRIPLIRGYWEEGTKYESIADVMSRNRFEKILRFLHIADNSPNW
ncbi:piggyBac transposable element-derived protein 5-like [Stegodyphus dumicola]|uniref:piggyBac transposable element-derived protein 5-like n=1 Tax=Stegodyphus dumicola TaxID=202533 RepID=UPI0015AF9C3A|nr:piggyBac transposable element-derived protein 5-like [Stegodyphus dumicola]